ncbi:hypothetical protein [Citrobacter amalonaticus]
MFFAGSAAGMILKGERCEDLDNLWFYVRRKFAQCSNFTTLG